MLTKSIDEITFEDVEIFCKEYPEGEQVEYKREIKSIPKIVSSFANTSGGIFIIGVEADKTDNRVIFPIQGIPKKDGIIEQIQQSAIMGISLPIMPEVFLVDVPDSDNMVVIIRVNKSFQAPHAIESATKVYFRFGSITQPYKLDLANMDLIEHMLKDRENSELKTQQILNEMEERAMSRGFTDNLTSITVTAHTIFSDLPLISKTDLYKLYRDSLYNPKRVKGGVCSVRSAPLEYTELNEYGVVYQISELQDYEQEIEWDQFVESITKLIKQASKLYKVRKYLGNIEVTVQLRQILDKGILDAQSRGLTYRRQSTRSFDKNISHSGQYPVHDLYDLDARTNIVEDLISQLLWPFDIPDDNDGVRKQIGERVRYWNE